MPDKKPEWSDYAYDDDSISERLDISKEDVKKLKAEAAKDQKKRGNLTKGNMGIGISANIDLDDLTKSSFGFGLKLPGVGVNIDTNGEGSIDVLSLIKVVTVRIKCYYVQRFYFADQFLYSDIIKIDSEECNKEPEPEPEPEPPDPDLDDITGTPKPPKQPGIPITPKPFQGFYSQKLSVYSRELEYSSGYSSTYKGRVESYINRLNLEPDPYSDIWVVTYLISVSWTVVNPKPGTSSGAFKRRSKTYRCLSPHKLRDRGIIIFEDFKNYYSGNIVYGEKTTEFAGNSGGITPYGNIQYYYGSDGKPGNSQTFNNSGTWAGGYILVGNTRSVPYFFRGGIIENFNLDFPEGQNTYHFTVETTQLINFEDLVSPQSTKNPPIRINDRGENMSEDCCRIVKRMAKILAVDKFPYKTTPEKIKELTAGYEQQIIEKPKEELTFGDYLALTEFTDIYSQYRLRQIADAVGVREFEREKNTPVGNILFAYFKYLKWLAENVGDFAMDYATWLRDVFPALGVNANVNNNGKTSSGNSEEKIDSIPKLLANQNKLVEEMHRVLGIDGFPASMPENLLATTISTSTVEVIEKEQIILKNYPELFGWFIDQFDLIMGQWTVDILIKDEDPLTPGDQPKKITLPNLAEAIAEIYGLVLQQNINTTTALNFESRILPEIGLTRQAVIKAFRAIETIIDYIGIEVLESEELIQHTFDPNADELEKILSDTPDKASVKVFEFDYKNGVTLKSALRDLAIAANIIKGVFARRLDTGDDPTKIDSAKVKEQIKQNVKDMEKNERIIRKKTDQDWEKFKSQIESDPDHNFKIKDI